MRFLVKLMVAFLTLLSFSVSAATPVLVRDIVTEGNLGNSYPHSFISHEGRFLFFIQGGHGRELWISDGTSEGTQPIYDFSSEGNFRFGASPVFASGDLVYFVTTGSVYGTDLWRTDGTVEGTFPLTEAIGRTDPYWHLSAAWEGAPLGTRGAVIAGAGGVFATDGTIEGTRLVQRWNSAKPERAGDFVVFVRQNTLWRTDGTVEGTTLIARLQDGYEIYDSISVGGNAYFVSYNGGDRFGFHRVDASASVREAGSVISYKKPALVSAGGVAFGLTGRDYTTEIWKIDETLTRVTLLSMGFDGAKPFTTSGHFFFDVVNNGIWRSDGTAGGTRRIAWPSGSIGTVGATSTRVYFSRGGELWTYMPDSDSFERLSDADDGLLPNPPAALATVGERILLSRSHPETGTELWTSDGTPGSVMLLKNIAPDHNAGGGEMQPFGARVLFSVKHPGTGEEPWVSDGTAAGTQPLGDLLTGSNGSRPSRFTDLGNGRAIFWATNDPNGREIWVTDGTAAGTSLLKDLGFRHSTDRHAGAPLLRIGGQVFLFTTFEELWTTNGTPEGTTLLARVDYDPEVEPVATDSLVFFSTETQLWRSDGTPLGTFPIGGKASNLEAAGKRVFFIGEDAAHGRELWVTDGSSAGTRRVADVRPGPLGIFDPAKRLWIQGRGDGVIFAADDGLHGVEPWSSDGTAEGTRMLADIAPGSQSSLLEEKDRGATAAFEELAYFTAVDAEHGHELWQTDGTPEGTRLSRDIAPQGVSSDPEMLRVTGGRLYFTANDSVHGRELWHVIGGVPELLADISAGPTSSYPHDVTRASGSTYLFATTDQTGEELWRIDESGRSRAVRK